MSKAKTKNVKYSKVENCSQYYSQTSKSENIFRNVFYIDYNTW